MPDWEQTLRDEFGAEEGSFLIRLRIELEWDRAAFTRLTQAMEECCRARADEDLLPRWMAEGFWYVPSFTRGHTNHPAWKSYLATDPDYYKAGRERLDDLAFWFFLGESPSLLPFAPL
ncbi:MAG: hypothetical protein H7Z41_18460 [Cytophagales bacterium]|nr:hypothetical protein [Armatimonadota bacterium]